MLARAAVIFASIGAKIAPQGSRASWTISAHAVGAALGVLLGAEVLGEDEGIEEGIEVAGLQKEFHLKQIWVSFNHSHPRPHSKILVKIWNDAKKRS